MVLIRWLAPWIYRMPGRINLRSKSGERLGHLEIGRLGEHLAARWLRRHGCKLLMRNYRSPRGGEIDIAAREGDILVFIEVKTRTSKRFGRPVEAVDAKKRKLIERGARAWLRQLPMDLAVPVRFDVVEVMLTNAQPPQINWLRNVFQSQDGLAWARRGTRYDPKSSRRHNTGAADPKRARPLGEPDRDHWMPL